MKTRRMKFLAQLQMCKIMMQKQDPSRYGIRVNTNAQMLREVGGQLFHPTVRMEIRLIRSCWRLAMLPKSRTRIPSNACRRTSGVSETPTVLRKNQNSQILFAPKGDCVRRGGVFRLFDFLLLKRRRQNESASRCAGTARCKSFEDRLKIH